MEFPSLAQEYIILIIAWTLGWKGFALWKAAKRGDKAWYVSMLILSSLGVLEFLYLFVFSKNTKHKKLKESTEAEPSHKKKSSK